MQAFPKSLGTVVIIFFPTEQGKRFKGYSVASTVASYVAVVEAGPYLTSVDIRPNTLCKGGSIKTTLYDPCFRSTTVVQGFPAVNSFLYRKSRNSLPVIVSGCMTGGPSPGFRAVCRAGQCPQKLLVVSHFWTDLFIHILLADRSAMCMYVFRRSFSTVHPTLRRQGYPLRHPREGNFLLAWIVPFITGYYCLLDIVRRTHNIHIPHGCVQYSMTMNLQIYYEYRMIRFSNHPSLFLLRGPGIKPVLDRQWPNPTADNSECTLNFTNESSQRQTHTHSTPLNRIGKKVGTLQT